MAVKEKVSPVELVYFKKRRVTQSLTWIENGHSHVLSWLFLLRRTALDSKRRAKQEGSSVKQSQKYENKEKGEEEEKKTIIIIIIKRRRENF